MDYRVYRRGGKRRRERSEIECALPLSASSKADCAFVGFHDLVWESRFTVVYSASAVRVPWDICIG